MLELVDDPVAVTFIIKEAAAMLRRIEGSGAVSPFAVSLPSNWRRRQERDGTGMSHASRAIAEALWLNPTTEKYVRRVAFELWAATNTETDLALLRQPGLPADLEVEILHERLKRRDRSATRALFLRINDAEKNAYMWWSMVRYIWSDDLLPALDAELARRAQAIEPKWQRGSDSDYVTSDLIMRLAPADAEKLLTKYWLSLRYVSYFVQAALYTGTPLTQELVRKAIIECPDPKILLTCIGQHIGIKTMDHPGITRQAQVVAFAPYLGHFAKHEVMDLWQLCNIHGWFEERKKFLDPYLRNPRRNPLCGRCTNPRQPG